MRKNFLLAVTALAAASACGYGTGKDSLRDGSGSAQQGLTQTFTNRFSFESANDLSNWKVTQGGGQVTCSACSIARVTTSTPAPVFEGTASMRAHIVAGDYLQSSDNVVHVQNLQSPTNGTSMPVPGSSLLYHIWFPAGAGVVDLHAYAKYGSNYLFNSTYLDHRDKNTVDPNGGWFSIYVPWPPHACSLVELGFDIGFSPAFTGDIYVDSIAW